MRGHPRGEPGKVELHLSSWESALWMANFMGDWSGFMSSAMFWKLLRDRLNGKLMMLCDCFWMIGHTNGSSQIHVECYSGVSVRLAEHSLRNASALQSSHYETLNTQPHLPIDEQSLTFRGFLKWGVPLNHYKPSNLGGPHLWKPPFEVLLFSGVIVDYLHTMPGTARVQGCSMSSVLQVLFSLSCRIE